MPLAKKTFAVACLLLIASGTAMAQSACLAAGEMSIHRDPDGSYHFEISAAYYSSVGAITGGAFTAEEQQETTRTLADGTHIAMKSPYRKLYRDSAGRTRTDREILRVRQTPSGLMAFPDSYVLVEICDPVGGQMYIIDDENRVAHRYPLTVGEFVPVSKLSHFERLGKIVSTGNTRTGTDEFAESLGTQTVEGIIATGVRTTSTHPAGWKNFSQPTTEIGETWYSPDLGLTILSKSSSPYNESAIRYVAITRDEPPLALFQPPQGFTVVDESGSFTMVIHPAKHSHP